MEALKRIIKDRDYHLRQIDENLMRIKEKYEAIEVLTTSLEKEKKLVEEYNSIIEMLQKED